MFLRVEDQHMSYISNDLLKALLETHGMFKSISALIFKYFLFKKYQIDNFLVLNFS